MKLGFAAALLAAIAVIRISSNPEGSDLDWRGFRLRFGRSGER
jgi:hypothetical protein